MSHQVLARRWRPHCFDDMLGQQHVLTALINALNHQRLHHAYLFSGTRGVGKTTIARIIAKCLNCQQGVSASPCGQCDNCQAIDQGRFIDLIEVDAASKTRVEDTRDLLDNVQYQPTVGRYKVYLIDEVHMLSNHSFNALLKTLEEPPAHVIFLLATTDPQKLPITILSRCLQFNLKSLSAELIAKHFAHILAEENISYDDQALASLSHAANGSVRDGLSLLEQAISYGDNHISSQAVYDMLGSMPQQPISELLQHVANKELTQALAQSQQMAENGADFLQVIDGLLQCLHDTAIHQALGTQAPDAPTTITTLSQQLAPENVQLLYQMALIGKRDLPLAADSQQGFNMLLLRMIAFQPQTPTELTTVLPPTNTTSKPPPAANATQAKPSPPATAKAAPITANPSKELDWQQVVPTLGLKGPSLLLAQNCALAKIAWPQLHLHLAPNFKALMTKKSQEVLAAALSRQLGHEVKLHIICQAHDSQTPAQIDQAAKDQAQADAKASVDNDDKFQHLLDSFDAKVRQDSVKPRADEVQS